MPRFELDKLGISDADGYFGKVVFTGSHENAMLALAQGTVDVAANQWTSDDDSTLAQMLHKGMLKNADGSPMKKDDFRIIHKSAPIINGPYAYNSDLPDDLKAAIAKAFTDAPTKDKAAFDRLSDGQKKGFHPATTKDWDGTIELIKFVDASAQEEGVLIDRPETSRGRVQATRPFSIHRANACNTCNDRQPFPSFQTSNLPCSTTPIARRSRASGCG